MRNLHAKRFFVAIALLFMLASCATVKKDYPVIKGEVAAVDEYGDLIPSFKVKDMLDAGYEYGDMLAVKIGDLPVMNMAFTTAYTDVGTMGICFCDYAKRVDVITIAISNASFVDWIGGKQGDSLEVGMAAKKGFINEYNAAQVMLSMDRNDYQSNEVFANFREISMPSVKPKTLYRSSNPVNNKKNKVRFAYVDKLARQAGIATEIDLADTNKVLEPILATDDFANSYCRDLYRTGNLIALGMKADFFLENSYEKMREGFRFMLSHKAPYLIHCNEGKDRCGAVMAVLEGLAGASVEEIKYDYMTTYVNYYKLERGDEKYKTLEKITIDRFVYLIANPDQVKSLEAIDWNKVTTDGIDFNKAAENYLLNCVKLTEDEVASLKALVKGNL